MLTAVVAIWQRIVAWFLAGFLAVLPLVLTVGIIVWVATFLQQFIGPETVLGDAVARLGLNFSENRTAAYAIGFLFVLGTIFLLGIIIELGAKRYFKNLTDGLLRRIPLVGNIYGTTQQVVEMFDHRDQSEIKSMSAVFCTFGDKGGAGVLALMPSPELIRINDQDYHVVLIPTAPVPFGGGLLFMPAESVKKADMSVDGLMSVYISMGVTAPGIMVPNKTQS